MEEEQRQKHHRGKSPQPRLNQVQIRASKASPVQARPAPASHSFSSNPQQARGPVGGVTRTTVTKIESDEEEWSEVSELQEIDPKRLQTYKDQNGNVDKRNFGIGTFPFSKLPVQSIRQNNLPLCSHKMVAFDNGAKGSLRCLS